MSMELSIISTVNFVETWDDILLLVQVIQLTWLKSELISAWLGVCTLHTSWILTSYGKCAAAVRVKHKRTINNNYVIMIILWLIIL